MKRLEEEAKRIDKTHLNKPLRHAMSVLIAHRNGFETYGQDILNKARKLANKHGAEWVQTSIGHWGINVPSDQLYGNKFCE